MAPAAVLAEVTAGRLPLRHDALDAHPAVHWVHQTGADWTRYAAELARERVHQP